MFDPHPLTETRVTKSFAIPLFLLGAIAGGIAVETFALRAPHLNAASVSSPSVAKDRVFEIRTYTVAPGGLPLLHKRFRDHTASIFARLGMENIGYWTPVDSALSQTTLIYVLAYPSREAATASWAAFRTDPEWANVRKASEAEGLKVLKAESVFVNPTDFSPMK